MEKTPQRLENREIQDITQHAFWKPQQQALRAATDKLYHKNQECCSVSVTLDPAVAGNYGSNVPDASVIISLEVPKGFKVEKVEAAFKAELADIASDCPFVRSVENGEIRFTVNAQVLEDYFVATKHAGLAQEYALLVKKAQLNHAMSDVGATEERGNCYAVKTAKVLSDDLKTTEKMVPVEYIARLANPEFNRQLFDPHNRFVPQFATAMMEKNPELAKDVAKKVKKLGFSKVALAGHGSTSLAFVGFDKDNKKRWILITPTRENRIPHPAMLPELARETAMAGEDMLMIRVMPEVDTGKVTAAQIEELQKLIKNSQLKEFIPPTHKPEIREGNVGIYNYTDEAGNKQSIPVILDWGAVVMPHIKDLMQLQQIWKTMPELKPWQDAQAHIEKEGQIFRDQAYGISRG